jgi:hypothetical protein
MADQSPPIEPDTPTRAAIAQEIADATGLGAKYIADQLTDAEAWETAAKLLQMGAVDEIRELIDPRFKAV